MAKNRKITKAATARVRVDIAPMIKLCGYEYAGLISNVQNFGSGWSIAQDDGGFVLISGTSSDGVMREYEVSREYLQTVR